MQFSSLIGLGVTSRKKKQKKKALSALEQRGLPPVTPWEMPKMMTKKPTPIRRA